MSETPVCADRATPSSAVDATAGDRGLLVAALEAVDQAVCVSDMRRPDEPIVYVNPAFTQTTGYTAAQALGRNCRFLQDGLDVGDAPARIRALLREGRSGVVTLPNGRADGTVFVNELSLSPLHDAEGVLTHYVAVQRDVTDRVEAERARDVSRLEQTELAEQLQRTLVPRRLPDAPGYALAVRYSPATRADGSRGAVSGDVYDLVPRPGGGWFAVIGDISGRGPRAAAATGVLRWSLRGVATTVDGPAELLRDVAAVVLDAMDGRFATAAVVALPDLADPAGDEAVMDGAPTDGALTDGRPGSGGAATAVVALAGHPRPVLLPADGPARHVGRHGSLLGVLPDVSTYDEAVPLRPGDQLVLFTDGVTETMDSSRQMLGGDGLLAALDGIAPEDRRGPHAQDATADAVLAAVEAHAGGPSSDDLTLLVIARPVAAP
ncbi:PP2C family protein-serine/threonine phosphatase [Pseudokineococcus sp. 1T1Z-3]|uniref:PP2C family protein-serine/threonine phosphatase n=1 Tax=Pseudokineococcus sp. 1T1Z-3 TaxID=3132745 RepID=UPI0030A02EB4